MGQQEQDGQARAPAQEYEQPAARGLPGLVRTDHASRNRSENISAKSIRPRVFANASAGKRLSRRADPGAQAAKISSIFAASSKSRLLMPPALCVVRSTVTLFHTLHHSGW